MKRLEFLKAFVSSIVGFPFLKLSTGGGEKTNRAEQKPQGSCVPYIKYLTISNPNPFPVLAAVNTTKWASVFLRIQPHEMCVLRGPLWDDPNAVRLVARRIENWDSCNCVLTGCYTKSDGTEGHIQIERNEPEFGITYNVRFVKEDDISACPHREIS